MNVKIIYITKTLIFITFSKLLGILDSSELGAPITLILTTFASMCCRGRLEFELSFPP